MLFGPLAYGPVAQDTIQTFSDLLAFLTGAGGATLLVAWAASWALSGMAWWEKLDSRAKSLGILGIALLLGVLATYVQSLPPEQLALIEPYMQTVIAVVGVWLATQVAHKVNPQRNNVKMKLMEAEFAKSLIASQNTVNPEEIRDVAPPSHPYPGPQ